jgi:branched-chain amino acid transport system substrate-binding protein
MKTYYSDGNLIDNSNVFGYSQARTLVQVLKQCGDNLSRENVMKQAASLRDFDTGVSLPGITINTSPSDFAPIKALQLARFDGKTWVPFGEVISK